LCCQVEIKLRLQDEEAHAKLGKALEPHFRETHKQENIFYDGTEGELSKKRVIVRTRFYNTDKRCLLTIKVCSFLLTSISGESSTLASNNIMMNCAWG